jgi:hypothetical protein
MTFDWLTHRREHFALVGGQLRLGDLAVGLDEQLDAGPEIGLVPVRVVARLAAEAAALTDGECHPQLAALVFAASGNPRALDHYFPLARVLVSPERDAFDDLVSFIAGHRHFDLRLLKAKPDPPGQPATVEVPDLPAGARHIVAGHLAETFFYRPDILERLLSAPRHFRLYTSQAAFTADGGEAGGSFDPERGALQLLLARLYEGFNGEMPGVAPFLHEFGHLLDFIEAATGRMGASQGLLPGLSPEDGAIFTPAARTFFLYGKRLELARYQAQAAGRAGPGDPLPVGHPYVFQNDTEFAAGYFEMFFRNPHYLAAQNPDLHAGFIALFGYDARRCWPQDFPFYVEQNQAAYRSGQRPPPAGITVPEE